MPALPERRLAIALSHPNGVRQHPIFSSTVRRKHCDEAFYARIPDVHSSSGTARIRLFSFELPAVPIAHRRLRYGGSPHDAIPHMRARRPALDATRLSRQPDRSGSREPRVLDAPGSPTLIDRVRDLLTTTSAAHPLVLLLDDMTDADEPSLRLLTALAPALRSLPVLIVVAVDDRPWYPLVISEWHADQTIPLLRRAVDHLRHSETVTELTLAEIDLADALRRAGDDCRARASADRARHHRRAGSDHVHRPYRRALALPRRRRCHRPRPRP